MDIGCGSFLDRTATCRNSFAPDKCSAAFRNVVRKFGPFLSRGSRATMNRILPIAATVPLLVVAFLSCAKKTPTLSLLVWEGYADPSYVRAFEDSHQCKVSASYMGSSDELVAKLRGGSASNYDVISPSSDVAT